MVGFRYDAVRWVDSRRSVLLLMLSSLSMAGCGRVGFQQLDAGADSGMDAGPKDSGSADADSGCSGAMTEICNGRDDDCDGRVDEGFDLMTDPENCGECGQGCDLGVTCAAGVCTCHAGQASCGGSCVDIMNDRNHCGACENACGFDSICRVGECIGCLQTVCGDDCVDTTTDASHCGGCGLGCRPPGTCTGTCICPAPLVFFAPEGCLDTLLDPLNCGAVGVSCADAEHCAGGVCSCRPGLTRVGAGCIDLQADPNNCGSPGLVCSTPTRRCSAGLCVATCPAGTSDCGGGCVDLDDSSLHCDECDSPCDVDEVCIAGRGCRDFYPALTCSACPCAYCDGDPCCPYPGSSVPICLEDGACG